MASKAGTLTTSVGLVGCSRLSWTHAQEYRLRGRELSVLLPDAAGTEINDQQRLSNCVWTS